MWHHESEEFMRWPSLACLRAAVIQLAGRHTSRHYRSFNFDRGMSFYAFAYLMDLQQGIEITDYAQAVVRHWGRIFTHPVTP